MVSRVCPAGAQGVSDATAAATVGPLLQLRGAAAELAAQARASLGSFADGVGASIGTGAPNGIMEGVQAV